MKPSKPNHKAKQDYLNETIIDKNYDLEQFITFITSQKIDGKQKPKIDKNQGCDLKNWTIADLKQIVSKFKENHTPIPRKKPKK